MCKKLILVLVLIIFELTEVFSTNVSIKSTNIDNSLEVKISNKLNKIDLKIKDNKIDSLDLLKINQNGILIEKCKLLENRYLQINNKSQYYINFVYPNLKITSTITCFNLENIDIKRVKYFDNNLTIETIYYCTKNSELDSFYYDFSNLEFTQKGSLNFFEYKTKYFELSEEIAFTRYGLFHSSTLSFLINKFKLYFNYKNINELYNIGFIFNYKDCKIKVTDKIFQISAYGGQGVKRSYSIDGDIKLNYNIFSINSILYFSTYHEISYDEFLNKNVKQTYRIRNKINIGNNKIEFSVNYNKRLSAYIKINNLKISYLYEKLDSEISYRINKDKSYFNIALTLKGKVEVLYNYTL